jgi:pimeloyl-ACP methyl ester carboxylesterase
MSPRCHPRYVRLLLGLLFLLSACGAAPETSLPVDDAVGESDPALFEATACPFDPEEFDQDISDVVCGYLLVPEARSDADSPLLELAVAIIPSLNTDPALDPIIYLSGGPGDSALLELDDWLETPFRETRDIILFDQRGTGFSLPSLNCPEVEELGDDDDETAAITACRDRLRDEGVNLAAYNSAASAADVADLRVALGYDAVNLLGISYGTRLALTTMRDYPEGIRSVILDSVYPPEVDAYTEQAANAAHAIQVLLQGCAADPACETAYPDLEPAFYDLVDQLNETPVELLLEDPESGETEEFYLDGDTLVSSLVEWLYDTATIPELPFVLDAAIAEDYEPLSTLLADNGVIGEWRRQEGDIFDGEGAYNSVECHEEIPFNDLDAAIAAGADYPPQLAAPLLAEVESLFETCDIWQAGTAAAIETAPVQSAIPTLLLVGEYDPVTPPQWGRQAATHLTNSFFFEVRGAGHSLIDAGPCPLGIAVAFIADPTAPPDARCLEALTGPDFVVP